MDEYKNIRLKNKELKKKNLFLMEKNSLAKKKEESLKSKKSLVEKKYWTEREIWKFKFFPKRKERAYRIKWKVKKRDWDFETYNRKIYP